MTSTRAETAAGLCDRAAWTESIRPTTPKFSAMPPLPGHLGSSNRGMALGTWSPTAIADAAASVRAIGGAIDSIDPPRSGSADLPSGLDVEQRLGHFRSDLHHL